MNVPPFGSIKDIEADYPNEWLKVEITKMAEDGFTSLEGRLMGHGKDQEELSKAGKEYIQKFGAVKGIYRNYTGEMEAEAVLLWIHFFVLKLYYENKIYQSFHWLWF